jgi:hypothetical protein
MDAHGTHDVFDLFNRYPHSPGHRGVDTSIEAAADLAPHLGRLQAMVRSVITDAGPRGLTSDEAAERAGLERYTVRARTAELRRMKVIVDSKQRRSNDSGRRAIVWVAAAHAPKGEA